MMAANPHADPDQRWAWSIAAARLRDATDGQEAVIRSDYSPVAGRRAYCAYGAGEQLQPDA